MSYEPNILILKKDLDKHSDLILCGNWQYASTKEHQEDQKTRGGEDNETVMEYLKWAYENSDTIKIGGIELISICPLFTSFNTAVRKKLYDLNVEFACDY